MLEPLLKDIQESEGGCSEREGPRAENMTKEMQQLGGVPGAKPLPGEIDQEGI